MAVSTRKRGKTYSYIFEVEKLMTLYSKFYKKDFMTNWFENIKYKEHCFYTSKTKSSVREIIMDKFLMNELQRWKCVRVKTDALFLNFI